MSELVLKDYLGRNNVPMIGIYSGAKDFFEKQKNPAIYYDNRFNLSFSDKDIKDLSKSLLGKMSVENFVSHKEYTKRSFEDFFNYDFVLDPASDLERVKPKNWYNPVKEVSPKGTMGLFAYTTMGLGLSSFEEFLFAGAIILPYYLVVKKLLLKPEFLKVKSRRNLAAHVKRGYEIFCENIDNSEIVLNSQV